MLAGRGRGTSAPHVGRGRGRRRALPALPALPLPSLPAEQSALLLTSHLDSTGSCWTPAELPRLQRVEVSQSAPRFGQVQDRLQGDDTPTSSCHSSQSSGLPSGAARCTQWALALRHGTSRAMASPAQGKVESCLRLLASTGAGPPRRAAPPPKQGPTLGSRVNTSPSPLSKGQQASLDTKANAAASSGACSSPRKPRCVGRGKPYLVSAEEWAGLGAADLAHGVLQVRVDLNLQNQAVSTEQP